jgi:inactive STAND
VWLVADNQCVLTKQGKLALDQLLKSVYPKAKQPNKSQIERDTGLNRETLIRILNNPPRPVWKQNLEILFEKLNKKIRERYKEQNQQRDKESQADYRQRINQGLSSKLIRFQESYCTDEIPESAEVVVVSTSQKQRRKSSDALAVTQSGVTGVIRHSGVSSQQHLAELLRDLNYKTGQARFEETMALLHPSGAYLLDALDWRSQRWLVSRLVQKVPGFGTGRRAEINAMYLDKEDKDLTYLWSELARQLRLELPDGTGEEIIPKVSELCQGKTVIIVLRRFQMLDREMQGRLIEDFWGKLLHQVKSQSQHWRSRLLLFLLQDGTADDLELSAYPFTVVQPDCAENPAHPVKLVPFYQFPSEEVQAWFKDEGVFERLSQQIGREAAEQFMQENRISRWSQPTPCTVLENICEIFRIDISEVERYWELTAG